jgi:hypothetical protein
MDDFLTQQNLARFRRQLTEPVEDSTRRILLTLLAEEKAKERARYVQVTDVRCRISEATERDAG